MCNIEIPEGESEYFRRGSSTSEETKLLIPNIVVPSYPQDNTVPDPQWMLETVDVPNPIYIYYVFSYLYLPMITLVYKLGTVRE